VMNSGCHVYPFSRSLSRHPFRGLIMGKSDLAPAPGSTLSLDPPQANITSSDGITGMIDVSVVASVLSWDESHVIEGTSQNFLKTSYTAINRWLANIVGSVRADEIKFHTLSRHLNAKSNLDTLNLSLRCLRLQVSAVNLDPSGIKLSKAYTKQRDQIIAKMQLLDAEERRIKKEMQVQKLKQEKSMKAAENHCAIEERQARSKKVLAQIAKETKMEADKAVIHRVQSLIQAGLAPGDVSTLLVAESAGRNISMSNSSKIIAIPPGLLGLGGLNGLVLPDENNTALVK